jgi:hypothetical protein
MKAKLIIGTVIAAVLLAGATIGVASAQTPSPTPAPPSTATPTPDAHREARDKALIEELANRLGLDPAQVETALSQAREQVRRGAMDATVMARLDKLVQSGKLSQSDADSVYTWFKSRPAAADNLLPQLGYRGGPGIKGHPAFKGQSKAEGHRGNGPTKSEGHRGRGSSKVEENRSNGSSESEEGAETSPN